MLMSMEPWSPLLRRRCAAIWGCFGWALRSLAMATTPVRTPWCILLGSTAGYYGSSVTVILFNKCTAHPLAPPHHGA